MAASSKTHSKPMQILDAVEMLQQQLVADGRSPHTVNQYGRHVRLFARWSVDDGLSGEVREIGHEDLARFLASPAARTRPDGAQKKASSGNALRTSMRVFFSYLKDANLVAEDSARLVRMARCGASPPRALSKADQERLLSALDAAQGAAAARDRVLFRLMLATGIRVGSAVELRIEDVDLEAGEVWLQRTKGDRPDKILLGPAIVSVLGGYVADQTTGWLFPGRSGEPMTTRHVGRRLAHWLEIAGIRRPASSHSLRHTFATELYRASGDLLIVMRALGHRSISSTVVYARCDEGRLRLALGA